MLFFPERSVDIPEDTLCPDSSEPTVVASETQQVDVKSTAEIATTSADDGVTIEPSNPVVTTDEVTLANTNTIATTNAATNTVAGTENIDASNTAAVNTETSAETNAIVATAGTAVISGSDETSQTIVSQTVASQSIQPSEIQSMESMQSSIVEQTTLEPQGCNCQNGGTRSQEGAQCTCQCTNAFTGDKCDSK